ncbi:MAG: hypothetical protein ABJI96_10360 [Paracoccaceae bacterium]
MSIDQNEPESVRTALSQVIGSAEFRASEKRTAFLEYVVQKALSDETETIKAYNIGIDIFGRGEDFDPQSDPVVRVEAGRLRRDLEHYYLTAGRDDKIVFAIPKGTYIPEIKRREVTQSEPKMAHPEASDSNGNGRRALQTHGLLLLSSVFAAGIVVGTVLLALWSYPLERLSVRALDATPVVASEDETSPVITQATLYVAPFASISPDDETEALAHGLTLEIAAITAQFPEVAVYPVSDGFAHRFKSEGVDEAPRPAEYLLSGSARIVGDELQVLAYMRNSGDGRQIWSEKFEVKYAPQAVFQVQDSIARSVSRKLAEPFGILRESVRNELRTHYDLGLEQYRCVLLGYEYRTSFTKDLHLRARECLERATRTEPEYARAWSLLALLVTDEVRMFHNPKPNASERSLSAARKAVELDPKDPISFQALSMTEFTFGSTAAGLAAARQAIELNPHNMEALWQLGFREWLSGNYEEGARISQSAIAGSPTVPNWFYWMPAAEQYRLGNYDRALEYAERMGTPSLIFVEGLRAMTYGQLGMLEQAQHSLDLCRDLEPDFDSRAREWFAAFRMHEDALDLFIEGLRKAGLAS